MKTHNPIQAIRQLQSILANPSKKIGFLFGAGISMQKMDGTDLIIGMNDKLDEKTGKIIKEGMTSLAIKQLDQNENDAVLKMKKEIESESKRFNIETLLSKISEKERGAGTEKLCGLTKTQLQNLRQKIEGEIQKIVSVHDENSINIENTNHHTFSKWIRNAHREFPVEIFTTNYDYLLELALEKERIPYFDGFIGSYEAFFCPEWIEDDVPVKNWIKLWKLHGSLGWSQNKNNEIIRTSGKAGTAMIYPSFLKYDNAKKQPYLSYMDRLASFLRQEDSVLFVCGYSFGDEHINEIILTSLTRSRSSHVFVLKNNTLKETDSLSKNIAKINSKISVYAKRSAVIGGKFGEWINNSKEDFSKFFKDDKSTSEKDWDGKGDLSLGNFKIFTDFLSDFYKGYND